MKIKKIIDVCKKEGRLTLISDTEGGPQWIEAKGASFALVGVPPVTLAGLCALYDIDPEEGFAVDEIFGKIQLKGDEPLTMLPMRIDVGSVYVPFKANDGTVYQINQKYLAPFAKDREISCILKRDDYGAPALVFKAGLSEIAEVAPVIPTEEHISMLETILSGADDFLSAEERRTKKLPDLNYEEEVLR